MLRNGRHSLYLWHHELRRPMLRVFLQELLQDGSGLRSVLPEEVRLLSLELFRPLPARLQGRIEGQVAQEVERIGLRLLGLTRQALEIDASLLQGGDDLRPLLQVGPLGPQELKPSGRASSPSQRHSR